MKTLLLNDFLSEDYEIIVINNKKKAKKAVALLSSLYPTYKDPKAEVLGLDIETAPLNGDKEVPGAGLNPHVSTIATIQIFAPQHNSVFVFHLPKILGKDIRDLSFIKKFIESRSFVAHNAQFELQHLIFNGVYPKQSIGCSMLLFRLLICAVYAQYRKVASSLQASAKIAFNIELPKSEQAGDWTVKYLSDDQLIYAAKDAIVTQKLAVWSIDKIEKYGLEDLFTFYQLNKKVQIPVAKMTLNGLKIDTKLHNKFIEEWKVEKINSEKQLRKIIPPNLNLNSSPQMDAWLRQELEKTEKGQKILRAWPRSEKAKKLKCDTETLSMFDELKIVKPLLAYKKVNKLLNTYGEEYQRAICPKTKRIHPSFTLCYTETGRMSCFKPNSQNVPRGEFRKIFVPEKGNIFVCADLGQIEVRVFAYHSGDTQLIEGFENGVDPYYLTASKLTGKPISEVSKDERQLAKAILLGRLYLLGAETLKKYVKTSYKLTISTTQAKEFIKSIDEGFHEGRRWQIETTERAAIILKGSSRMGKLIKYADDKYYNKSVNHPIQSDAAACMLQALINIDNRLRKAKVDAKLVNAVHDEILIECKKSVKDRVRNMLLLAMEEGVTSVFPEATLNGLVNVNFGDSWYDAK